MKKIAFIGHSFHKKTRSAQFFLDLLKMNYRVEEYYDESWHCERNLDTAFIDDSYHAVIFWQRISKYMLKKITIKNIVYIPMYDADGEASNYYWHHWKDLKIINFSGRLDRRLKKLGFDTLAVRYFPPISEFIAGEPQSIFFWQRVNSISWPFLKQRLDLSQILNVHIHKAVDPYHRFIQPSKEDEIKYKITYSEWFDTKENYWDKVNDKSIYIAPRYQEGIGMSFLEAMARGKVVVAVDQPTMNEYIEDGYNGYLMNIKKMRTIDFGNISTIQKNAYKTIVEGQDSWKRDKEEIIKFIDKPNGVNIYFKENPLEKYKGIVSVNKIKTKLIKIFNLLKNRK